MSKIRFPAWTVPPALLLLCLVSYGLLIPRLGYYWDDWPAIWFTQFYGSASLVEVLGIDRPQLAWLYYLTTSLIDESAAGWQIFALLMRWLSCLALWWLLQLIWPGRRTEATWTTFLFAIYPGFRQQYIALIYCHDWIVIGLFFLSLGWMIIAVRGPHRQADHSTQEQAEHSFQRQAERSRSLWTVGWLAASLGLAAYVMFADEYYFGLELLRPVLLWMALKDQVQPLRQRLQRVALSWLPYLAVMLAFLAWRLFIHVSPRGQVQIINQLAQNPFLALLNLAKTVVLDILESGLVAWALPFNLFEVFNSGATSLLAYLLLAALVGGGVWFYFQRAVGRPGAPEGPSWPRQAVLLGLFALFIGGWPFWATAWQIGLSFPWDRFNLAMNLGASLLLAGLFSLLFRRQKLAIIALAVVIGLSSANAYHLANLYRQDWELLKQFFWQMSWRVPGIAPDTVILTHRPPFAYSTDNSLTAPLNWIYAPQNQTRQLPYLFWDVASHLPDGWNSIDASQPLQQQYRILDFDGSYSRALSIVYKPPNCIKLLDPEIDKDLPGRPLYITPGAAFSKPELVVTNPAEPARPPSELFGPEPPHGWCYFFEKAELARQVGDWPRVVELADQALSNNYPMTEANALEWIPYIEGYARSARWEAAEQWSLAVYQAHPKMRRMLCSLWDRVESATPASSARDQLLEQMNTMLACAASDED